MTPSFHTFELLMPRSRVHRWSLVSVHGYQERRENPAEGQHHYQWVSLVVTVWRKLPRPPDSYDSRMLSTAYYPSEI